MRGERKNKRAGMPPSSTSGGPTRLPPESFDRFLDLLDESASPEFKDFASGSTRWEPQSSAPPPGSA